MGSVRGRRGRRSRSPRRRAGGPRRPRRHPPAGWISGGLVGRAPGLWPTGRPRARWQQRGATDRPRPPRGLRQPRGRTHRAGHPQVLGSGTAKASSIWPAAQAVSDLRSAGAAPVRHHVQDVPVPSVPVEGRASSVSWASRSFLANSTWTAGVPRPGWARVPDTPRDPAARGGPGCASPAAAAAPWAVSTLAATVGFGGSKPQAPGSRAGRHGKETNLGSVAVGEGRARSELRISGIRGRRTRTRVMCPAGRGRSARRPEAR